MKLIIDFETRSYVDIKTAGAEKYARDPSTQALCLAVLDGDSGALLGLWINTAIVASAWLGNTVKILTTAEVLTMLAEAEEVMAHSAPFEAAIMEHVLAWPVPPTLACSAAKAAACGLPRSLDSLCLALGQPGKDRAGYAVMLKLCKPGKDGQWQGDRSDFAKLCAYCVQDTRAERSASLRLPRLSDAERAVWAVDQVINRRGVKIDANGCRAAIAMVDEYQTHLRKRFYRLTAGRVRTPTANKALLDWLHDMGHTLTNLSADIVEHYIAGCADPVVKEALEIRLAMSKASVAKYTAALASAGTDDRVRGVFIYHAAATGRWTSTLLQLHNMPRGHRKLAFKDDRSISEAYATMAQGWEAVRDRYPEVTPMDVASTAVRGMVVADSGMELLASDFSAIEARMLAYLAGEESALDVFRQDLDPYKVAASGIFGVGYDDVGKGDKRQVGKVSELALGYGGGIEAFVSMARVYRLDLDALVPLVYDTATPEEQEAATRLAREVHAKMRKLASQGELASHLVLKTETAAACDIIKRRWRVSRPRTVQFWRDLEDAAQAAVRNPGKVYEAGPFIRFAVSGEFLCCRLPSGRVLRYYRPSLELMERFGRPGYVLHYWAVKAIEGRAAAFGQVHTYGGKLSENVVQAACADLLRHAMLQAEAAGYPIVLHVHDELVAECPRGSRRIEDFDQLIAQPPTWAAGMPMAATGWAGQRYRKD